MMETNTQQSTLRECYCQTSPAAKSVRRSKDFPNVFQRHKLSSTSGLKAMRTAEPRRTSQLPGASPLNIQLSYSSDELSAIRRGPWDFLVGVAQVPVCLQMATSYDTRSQCFHVYHSTSYKYNKACWRMALDRWPRVYCCLFSTFHLILCNIS